MNAATDDPYFQHIHVGESEGGYELIVSSRPLVLMQGSEDSPGVVNITGDRELIVYADEVTIFGRLRVHAKVGPLAEGQGTPGQAGCPVTIVARTIATDGSTPALIDVSGTPAIAAPAGWPVAARAGKTGDAATDIICMDPESDAPFERRAGDGESALMLSTSLPNPSCSIHGKKGPNGATGGDGAAITLICMSFAPGTSLGLQADGGAAAAGVAGQEGGKGGKGGDGYEGNVECLVGGDFIRMLRNTVMGRTMAIGAGNGGRGGDGGAGGDGAAGGAPGSVRVRVLFGVSYGAVDTKLLCNPGKDGASGDGGDPGTKGVHGNHPSSYDFAPAADGKDGAHGAKIAGAKQTAAACTIDAAGQCTTSDLLVGLHVPMSGYLFMLLETIRSAMLAAGVTATVHNVISAASPPGAQGAPDDDKLSLRMSWLGSLLNLYTPLSGGEMSTLDGLRSVATMMARRWAAGLDYYGHSAMYAPLGSMDLHLDAFTHAVNSYDDAQQRLAQLSGAATTGTNETDLLAQTKAKLQADQTAYDTAANDLRKQIPTILDSIKLRQADLDGARAKLLTPDAQALHDALRSEFSANAADVFECLSQFAFFPEMGPQKGAMMIGQLGKLIYNGATKVRLDDEQTAGKDYLIQQLAEVSDFSTALGELSTKGTTEGIALADPGAVKLLSLKKDLDAFCEKLFVKHPAAEKLKKDFDDFVTSVQQRNADIVAFNETLSLLEGYLAGSNQTAASLSDDGEDIAFRGSPGAPTMTAQANRMLQRSRDDAIHQLYLASRAYFMWALDPDDQLSKNLSLFAGGNDLALEPETLNQVESAMYVTRAQAIDARLSDGGGWRPDRAAPLQARGIFAEFTNATHPEALKALLTKSADGIYSTVLILPAVRFGTAVEGSLFGTVGVADVRLRRVRAWIIGARTEDQILQLTISHIGRETMVTPMDEPMDVHHPKLDVQMSYDMSFGECNPQCLANVRQANADGDILFDADGLRPQKVPLAGLVGPFGAWKVSLRDLDNRKLDMSGVTAVRFEFFCHVRAFDSDAIVSGIQHH